MDADVAHKAVYAEHHDGDGDARKPIWITEYGAPSRGPKGVGDARQAAEMAQAILDARKVSWIGTIYLYTWQDRPKKAYWAVKTAILRRLP